jgi:hypothetical protein
VGWFFCIRHSNCFFSSKIGTWRAARASVNQ